MITLTIIFVGLILFGIVAIAIHLFQLLRILIPVVLIGLVIFITLKVMHLIKR